jgi:hypothetical protein
MWYEYAGPVAASLLPKLHKQHGKEYIIVFTYEQYCIKNMASRMQFVVNSKDGIDFAMLFTLETTRKAGVDPAAYGCEKSSTGSSWHDAILVT